ncbi:MAG: oxygen-independent coproporphyrinogen III oxidase [Clostridium butyricum]|nr:oxygen-independent coproporphyrinogen III oxidase [Clostridium butyricum]
MKEISLYVHIPFCKQKCMYCDFPSYAGKEKYMDDYIEALNEELLKKREHYLIRSIFIGGGTPSYLDEKNLESLLLTLNKLNFKENVEFTIECNPGTLTREKLEIMKKYNINRLSIGLQSTNNMLLKDIGRIHTYEIFKNNFLLARQVGFENINVDLMFGLPNQSLEEWRNTLLEIAKLSPEHISAYSLIIEEGTCFYNLYNADKLNLPSEEIEREMYICTKEVLNKHGYNQYEISNYSKPNKECLHNKIYWSCKEYLGVGASASSFINNARIKNIDDIDKYIKNISRDESIVEEVHENNIKDSMEEFMFMGLRMTEGIDINEFAKRFDEDIYKVYGGVIEKYINKELLASKEGKLYLTSKGIELSNYVMSDFILT